MGTNGVVHIINQVLTNTVVDLAIATPTLSTLVAALTAGDLVTTLQGIGLFTVFAPTDDAFNALPAAVLTSLLEVANKPALVSILQYHVVSGKFNAAQLTNGQEVPTLLGANVKVSIDAGVYKINTATVTTPDVEATNGVVHIINQVLTNTVVDLAVATPTLSTLVAALTAGDLVTTLQGIGLFTVFAPTDDAFNALPAAVLTSLLEVANKPALVSILQYHVVSGKFNAAQLTNGQEVP